MQLGKEAGADGFVPFAEGAGVLIIAAAVFNAKLFGDRDLDVIDISAVPYRLKSGVCKTKGQDVLDGLFSKIMIDAVNLRFDKNFGEDFIELAGRSVIMTEWFFDNNTIVDTIRGQAAISETA